AMSAHNRATVGRVELSSRRLLTALYQAARWLSLLSCTLTRNGTQIQLKAPRRRCNRLLIILWRSVLVNIYGTVVPGIFRKARLTKSYADVFAMLQSTSVSLFAVVSFVLQVKGESRFLVILNRYIALYQRICELRKKCELFPLKFVGFYALKLSLTVCGALYELPQVLPLRYIVTRDVERLVGGVIGIYMWMGTLFLLDACFLGFFVSGLLYEQMGAHIAAMLQRMHPIDRDCKDLTPDIVPLRLSHYRRMCFLCDRADELDACGIIYSELYSVTISFRRIFQLQILFYIYYNFIVLLLMLYEYIWNFLEAQQGDLVPILLICIKMANIVLLIMCADYTICKSQLPQTLPLDIVCSDIDPRWDKSVESFLGQLQTQPLEIKVLGILELNNTLIPVIISAIMTYLFILIQFGFTGGFDVAEEIIRRNL
ncbi:hypothetical protein KR222_005972, partial [Zaprionus bogoriensis]